LGAFIQQRGETVGKALLHFEGHIRDVVQKDFVFSLSDYLLCPPYPYRFNIHIDHRMINSYQFEKAVLRRLREWDST